MPETEEGSASGEEMEARGQRPDFRVVQPEYDARSGKTIFKDVGAMWKGTSKTGNEFYTLKIGKLRLLVFPNNR
ncbi:MAG: DUF736 domain-containing protein [Candidatus Micrarchaeota archaeon]|nr:DUF736 domain-containing protein [Candidatus Micrarchaeota archaeon]